MSVLGYGTVPFRASTADVSNRSSPGVGGSTNYGMDVGVDNERRNKIFRVIANRFLPVAIAVSSRLIGPYNSSSKILVVLSVPIAVSLQGIWDINDPDRWNDVANHLKFAFAYQFFEVMWQVWDNLSQTSWFQEYADLVTETTLVPIMVYAMSCWAHEIIDILGRKKIDLNFTVVSPESRNTNGTKILFPRTSNWKGLIAIGAINLVATGIFTGLSFKYPTSLWWGQYIGVFTTALPLGYAVSMIVSKIRGCLQNRFKENYPPGTRFEHMPWYTKTLITIDKLVTPRIRELSGLALALENLYGYGISGFCQGMVIHSSQLKFENIKLIGYEEGWGEQSLITIRAAKISKWIAIIFLTGATGFFTAVGILAAQDDTLTSTEKKRLYFTAATVPACLLASFGAYKLVQRVWDPRESGRVLNTIRFFQAHYPDPIPLASLEISRLIKNADTNLVNASNLKFGLGLAGWVFLATGLGLDTAAATDVGRTLRKSMTAIATLVMIIVIVKVFLNTL